MSFRPDRIEPLVGRVEAALLGMTPSLTGNLRAAIERWRGDAGALRFHLKQSVLRHDQTRPVVAIVGGTGTGKSTLVNRLVGAEVSAASFRRTFTSGAVAIVGPHGAIPNGWLGAEHIPPPETPARGSHDLLTVVHHDQWHGPALIDTPDLDGDQPVHHAQADRVFRWAQAAVFVVTPEKYQMTELLPYYRLAKRYGVAALFVMNKCEEHAVLEDYRKLLRAQFDASAEPRVFVISRDDAGYEPPADANLDALRGAINAIQSSHDEQGLLNRTRDLLGRLDDQVINPLTTHRREVDEIISALRSMETPAAGVDVNPITQQLRRRLQERSILYLMGPQRVLDRIRQAPGLLARLPRIAWDYIAKGEIRIPAATDREESGERTVPDFQAVLTDQFAILQSRIDDRLRASNLIWQSLSDGNEPGYQTARLAPTSAGEIAAEELAGLRDWLEKKWNATPRDTRMLNALLKHLPGGSKLSRWSESAPYLLTVILVAHHAMFWHVDIWVIGGYTLATWLTERLSNEVASRTRATNVRIAERFTRLSHEQIERVAAYLDSQSPPMRKLEQLQSLASELSREV